jgi:hypothetical protein
MKQDSIQDLPEKPKIHLVLFQDIEDQREAENELENQEGYCKNVFPIAGVLLVSGIRLFHPLSLRVQSITGRVARGDDLTLNLTGTLITHPEKISLNLTFPATGLLTLSPP